MKTSDIIIEYDLGRGGWSSFKLSVGSQSFDVGAFSHTTDALDDLIMTGIQAAVLSSPINISLDGEPMEWRLIIDEMWKPRARLRILTFADIYEGLPEDQGRLEFEVHIRLEDYARAVQAAGHDLWKTYGAQGYREAWGRSWGCLRGFPLKALNALDAALATNDV